MELCVGFRSLQERRSLAHVRQLSVWVPLSEEWGIHAEAVAETLKKHGQFLALPEYRHVNSGQ